MVGVLMVRHNIHRYMYIYSMTCISIQWLNVFCWGTLKSLYMILQFSLVNHIYFSSIVKQILATYINHSRVRLSLFPGTNQYWCHMRNHGRDPCGVWNHDLEVARQTPYPLGHCSPYYIFYKKGLTVIFVPNFESFLFFLS